MSCMQCKDTNVFVYIIIIIFGCGTWMPVSAMFVELPVIVPQLPEAWRLPSYLSIIIQIANISPIVFSIVNHFFKERINERVVIFVLLAMTLVSCLVLAFFWKTTITIFGVDHSVVLLAMMFCFAFVNCSSAVTFIPFMAIFKPQYITAFCIGQSLSGLVPSLVAFGQGVGKPQCVNTSHIHNTTMNESIYKLEAIYREPRFSFAVFQFILFFLMCVCSLSYAFMLYAPICKREYATVPEKKDIELTEHNQKLLNIQENTPKIQTSKSVSGILVYLSVLSFWISLVLYGTLLPVQSYSCLPYGHDVYHLTVVLVYAANPVSSFLTFLFPDVKTKVITILIIMFSGIAAYILYVAASSPMPVLQVSVGPVFIITAWIVTSSVGTFCKVSLARKLRNAGRAGLRLYGISGQAGAFAGSVTMYILINKVELFEMSPKCV